VPLEPGGRVYRSGFCSGIDARLGPAVPGRGATASGPGEPGAPDVALQPLEAPESRQFVGLPRSFRSRPTVGLARLGGVLHVHAG
jgi:hypothetical protein